MTENAVIHKRFSTMVKVLYVLSYVPLTILILGVLAVLAGIVIVPFIPLNLIEDRMTQMPIVGTYESTGLTLEITEAYLKQSVWIRLQSCSYWYHNSFISLPLL